MAETLSTLVVGFVAGVLSGMFGIGGGVVTTPALRLLLGAPALIAVGTPLPVILPTALSGAWSYSRHGLADIRTGLVLGLVGAPVSVLAALATRLVGGRVVLLATAVLIAYLAAEMIRGALRTEPLSAGAPPYVSATLPRVVLLGTIAGAYSGFLGLGGGFVLVPGINRFLGFELKRSIGTSLVAVALLAVPGSVTHYLLGNVDVALAAALTVGVVPGGLLGARIALGTHERVLRIAFAALLVVTGIILVMSESGVI